MSELQLPGPCPVVHTSLSFKLHHGPKRMYCRPHVVAEKIGISSFMFKVTGNNRAGIRNRVHDLPTSIYL
jgi:hypothetical protein